MARKAIKLTEDQARNLEDAMPAIMARHPADALNWRAFVDDFIRAVHAATGQTYSPLVYRRFMDEYAPGRTPATETLESAKKDLVRELASQARAAEQLAAKQSASAGPDLAQLVEKAVARVLASAPRNSAEAEQLRAQFNYLQDQLASAEKSNLEVRGRAARLAGELLAANESRAALQEQLGIANMALAAQIERVGQLAEECQGARLFAMNAIDAVRGETRAVQERVVDLEARLKRAQDGAEVYRQMAYRAGSAPAPIDKG